MNHLSTSKNNSPTFLHLPHPQDRSAWASAVVAMALYITVRSLAVLIIIALKKNLSNPTSTLLLLRLHNLHNISHHQHLHHSSNNPIRPYLRTLPPPHPPLLPIPSHGAPPCHAPSPNTHRIWPHPADPPPQRLPGPLRRLRTLD